MSRIGKKPVAIAKGAKVEVSGQKVTVSGPKGELSINMTPLVSAEVAGEEVVITVSEETRAASAQHGLHRSLINNMITGVTTGWTKELEIRGTGYRGSVQGNTLNLNLGYSHPINYAIPAGITVTMPEQTKVIVTGADKQLVGQVAADIRFFRRPEPYKGKGVRYVDEHIALKEGKSAGKK